MKLAALVVLVGCGSSDGPPSCDGAGDVVELDLLADTYIDGTAAHGGEGLVQIGNGSRGMFRFSLGPNLSTRDLKFNLVLTVPTKADDCAPGCGACPAAVAAGGVTVSLVRSDWKEPEATSELRDGATPWSMPGPAGVDVVQLAATSATASGNTLSIGFNALGLSLNPSWPADQVTVMVNPSASSTNAINYSSRSNDCEPAAAPKLTAECTAASP